MKDLIKSLTDLPKHYVQLMAAKIGALIVLFALLIILTLFAAFVMIVRWQWTPELTFTVCFVPWLIVFATLILIVIINSHRLKVEKRELYEAGKQHLLLEITSFLVACLFKGNKKKKKSRKVEQEDE